MPAMTEGRALRSDARRNRELLLGAARTVIAERGADAPLEEIARRAGVGIGTLYRHFPDRADLIDALVADRVGALAEQAESLLDTPRAFDGLVTVLEQAVASQEADLALRDALIETRATSQLDEVRLRWRAAARALVDRARSEGDLRGDIGYADVVVALWGLGRIVEATARSTPGAWRRHLAIVLAGLGAAGVAVPGAPLADGELDAGARVLHDRHRRRRGLPPRRAPRSRA
jgi:AcrR family transcriptional regulator